MKLKRLILTGHALKRMKQRMISYKEIEDCYLFGQVGFTNSGCQLYYNETIRIVVSESRDSVIIITVTYLHRYSNKIDNIIKNNVSYNQAVKQVRCELGLAV